MSADYRKLNDGSHNSSTYHKKDGTPVRAILKRETLRYQADVENWTIGWNAAKHGESRKWCEQFGETCLAGYDEYWEVYGPEGP